MENQFFKLSFRSDLLYIGERIKKGTFKPSIAPISSKYRSKSRAHQVLPLPYSTITGAIKSILGDREDIHAIGKILNYKKEYMSVAPYDTAICLAKLPITIEYLTGVEGEIYVQKTDGFYSPDLIRNELCLGGLKSKGFGKCDIVSSIEIEPKRTKGEGIFQSRVYYEDHILKQFGISKENIIKPFWGYLFRKTSIVDGYYEKSIFENTIVKDGYNFIVEEIK